MKKMLRPNNRYYITVRARTLCNATQRKLTYFLYTYSCVCASRQCACFSKWPLF